MSHRPPPRPTFLANPGQPPDGPTPSGPHQMSSATPAEMPSIGGGASHDHPDRCRGVATAGSFRSSRASRNVRQRLPAERRGPKPTGHAGRAANGTTMVASRSTRDGPEQQQAPTGCWPRREGPTIPGRVRGAEVREGSWDFQPDGRAVVFFETFRTWAFDQDCGWKGQTRLPQRSGTPPTCAVDQPRELIGTRRCGGQDRTDVQPGLPNPNSPSASTR